MKSIKSQIAFQKSYVRHLTGHLADRVAASAESRSAARTKLETARAILVTLNKYRELSLQQGGFHG